MDSDYFDIDRVTGLISVTKPLSKESKYSLTVKVTDDGIPQLSSNISFIIVTSNGDKLPEFQLNFYNVTVSENVTKGSEVIQVHATTFAKRTDVQVFYSIVSGNDDRKFRLNSKTGDIIWFLTIFSFNCFIYFYFN